MPSEPGKTALLEGEWIPLPPVPGWQIQILAENRPLKAVFPCASASSLPRRSISAAGSGTYVGMHVLAARAREPRPHGGVRNAAPSSARLHAAATAVQSARSARRTNSISRWASIWMATASPPAPAARGGAQGRDRRRGAFRIGRDALTMSMQARCERLHVQRAARVLVTSRYSGERAQEFYGLAKFPAVVPELIDLAQWRSAPGTASAASPRASRCSSSAASTAETRGCAAAGGRAIARMRSPSWKSASWATGPATPPWQRLWRRVASRRRP